MDVMTSVFLGTWIGIANSNIQDIKVHGPWLPVKDALVTVQASSDAPPATYVNLSPSETGHGRRLPAIFLVKTPKEEEVVAYLTGIDGNLGEELLTVIKKEDMVLQEYMPNHLGPIPPTALEKLLSSTRTPLPYPFGTLPLTRVVLPEEYISLSDLARFFSSTFEMPNRTVSFILAAERSDIFP